MKAIGVALLAILAIGCNSSGSPTSPTTPSGPPATTSQDVKPTHSPGTQSATIYFNARQLELVGHEHLVGLPVQLEGFVNRTDPVAHETVTMNTGKQGTVTADFAKADTWIHVTTPLWQDTDQDRDDEWWCATDQWVPLPYVPRENWVNIFVCAAP